MSGKPHDANESAEVREQVRLLRRGAVDLVQEKELRQRLTEALVSGRPLRVKVGFDPSSPDIHLGHTVVMRKMRDFQRLGHEVVFVIGDFTGRIGDPTGRSKTRPQLTAEQIELNARTYQEQAFKILDADKTVVEYNGRWLRELGSEGFVRLAATYTVARMLERDDFAKRYAGGQPIGVHEFLYPLAQAYDSVALAVDVELGGTDQLFNLLVGRDVMREYGQTPQIVMTLPLLVGTDGVEKMSKSLGNAIGVTDPPNEMFGKLMSISDELMWSYMELVTDVDADAVERRRQAVAAGRSHPRSVKAELAGRVVADFHGADAARAAAEAFDRQFVHKEVPDDVPELALACRAEPLWLVQVLVEAGLARSNGEARRLIRQGGVRIDGERVEDEGLELDVSRPCTHLLRVGKRRFLRVEFRGE